jgi:predicted transcriptional regulator
MARGSTLFEVKAREERWLRANGLRGVLNCLFYKNPSLVDLAEKLLTEIKKRKGLPASEWKECIKKFKTTISSYESCLQRLKAAGLIRRERGIYYLSGDFSRFLNAAAEIWMEWRAT